jgi:hypothetical protein
MTFHGRDEKWKAIQLETFNGNLEKFEQEYRKLFRSVQQQFQFMIKKLVNIKK